jgi:hypothetical protein
MLVWPTVIRLVRCTVKRAGRTGSHGFRMREENRSILLCWSERAGRRRKSGRVDGRTCRELADRRLLLGFLFVLKFLGIAETENLAVSVTREDAVRSFRLE